MRDTPAADPHRDPAAWSSQARLLCQRLEEPTLAAFLHVLGDDAGAARVWGDATRATAWESALSAVLAVLLEASAEQQSLPADVGLPALDPMGADDLGPLVQDLRALVLRDHQQFPADLLGVAFENLLGRLPRFDGDHWVLGHAGQRRTQGVFFTPPTMVRFLVHHTLRPLVEAARSVDDILLLRVVDPAMGAGFFLLDVLRYLADAAVERAGGPGHLPLHTARRLVAKHSIHGVDVDPRAVDLAQALLWLAAGDPDLEPAALDAHLYVADALLDRGMGEQSGFDAVLSNPPWGKIKPALKEFHAYVDHGVSDRQGRSLRAYIRSLAARDTTLERAWADFRAERLAYADKLKSSGGFHCQRVAIDGHTTGGDPDLYKYFMERMFHLVHTKGRLGLVIPSAFVQAEGATGLRQLYLGQGRFEILAGFENRKRYFPIHGMFRYSLAVYQKGRSTGVERLRFGLHQMDDLNDLDGPGATPLSQEPRLSLAWLKQSSGPRLSIPEVRTRAERDLFARLHERFEPLGQHLDTPWNLHFVRELDMTNHRGLFREAHELRQANDSHEPLYEGRMVHQFNHNAKAYQGGGGRRAQWIPLPHGTKQVRPHYWVDHRQARRAQTDDALHLPRAGYCDITGHANERTVLAALIPANAPCGNKVPTVRFEGLNPFAPPDLRLPLLWLAIANSFVVDWLLRRRISTTLNFFYWYQVPFPRLDPADPDDLVTRTLWTTAARLSYVDAESTPWGADLAPLWPDRDPSLDTHAPLTPQRRAALRADLDATVALLYGVSPADMDLILADFPLLDRGQPAPITANLVRWTLLRHLGQHHTPAARALKREIDQAEAAGAVAYIPSELALYQNKPAQKQPQKQPQRQQ